MIDHGDGLAAQAVQPAGLGGDVLDQHVAGDPVVAQQRKHPREDGPVGGVAAAVARGDHGDFVNGQARHQGEGDAGRERLEHRGTAVAALEALVALHAAVGGVGGFAFLDQRLHAVEAAARVDQLHVVGVAIGKGGGVGGHGTGAPGQAGEELHRGRGRGRGSGRGLGLGHDQAGGQGSGRCSHGQGSGQREFSQSHLSSPKNKHLAQGNGLAARCRALPANGNNVSAGTATDAACGAPCSSTWPGRAAP